MAAFAGDNARPVRRIAEWNETLNLVYWSESDRGGHFAAMEEPELFTADVRAFFRGLRRANPAGRHA
ncbi:hypothetical protein [Rhizohabitans arisaemae]|uniref:hypothetical protein n=1 Tax=Rhizohabitans arisaemae TaxID=2720610 RepID=UPI0024B1C799|nr:hypothetical protein [Rhizohabitans arisaemae]